MNEDLLTMVLRKYYSSVMKRIRAVKQRAREFT